MKKSFLAILVGVLLFVPMVLTGCGSSESGDVEDPLADGTLTIGTHDTYVPLEYRNDNNEIVGFDIDLGNAISKELGVDIEWVPTEWDGIFTGLDAKQYDMILSGVSLTSEREENFAMTKPYIANGIVIVSSTSATPATEAKDLEGQTVGVQLQTTADIAAQDMKTVDGVDFTLKQFDSAMDAFSALEGQTIDYIIVDQPLAAFYAAQKPDKYTITSEVLSNEPIAIACRKENTAFRDQINDALDTLVDNGTMAELSEKWFNEDLTQNISDEVKTYE